MIANMNVFIKFEKFISKTKPIKDEKAARKCSLFVFLYKLRDFIEIMPIEINKKRKPKIPVSYRTNAISL